MQKSDDFLAAGCRYFLLVAEAGSVRAAARQANTAASAISRQIALLEASLGIALFERSGRTLRLAPAGEELRRALTSSALLHEQALDRLNALRGLSLRSLLDPVARRQKLLVKPAMECNSLRVMASLAARGLCVAFQTPIGIEQELSDRRLRFIPLADRNIPPDRMMLVHRPGLDGHAAATAFLEHARSRMEKLFAVPKNRTVRGK